jgi:hypothetical protein
MDRNTCFVAMAVAAASFGLVAQADDPAAPRIDPPRWSVPAETPAQKYAVAVQEAGAAMDEALKECRATNAAGAGRKACEAAARELWKQETREARRLLLNDGNTPR